MNERPDFSGIEEDIPAGLEFKEAYWDAALLRIKAREAFLFRIRLAFGIGIALLIGVGGSGWYYLAPSSADFTMLRVSDQNIAIPRLAVIDVEAASGETFAFATNQDDINLSSSVKNHDEVGSDERQDDSSDLEETDIAQVNSIAVPESTVDHAPSKTASMKQEVLVEDQDDEVFVTPQQMVPVQSTAELDVQRDDPRQDIPDKGASATDLMASYDASAERVGIFCDFRPMSKILPLIIQTEFADLGKLVGAIVDIKSRKLIPAIKPFNVQVIMGSSFVAEYDGRKDDFSFNPLIGVVADLNLNRRYSVNAGIQYFSIKGTSRPFSSQVTVLDFVRETTTTSVATKKMHYISLPINVAMRLGHRTQLSAGFGISALAQTQNLVTVSKEINGESSLESQYREDGYVSGFKTVNSFLNFGVNYYLTSNTTWGLTYQYGLSDVTRNDFFTVDEMDRNSKLSVYVRFNVF